MLPGILPSKSRWAAGVVGSQLAALLLLTSPSARGQSSEEVLDCPMPVPDDLSFEADVRASVAWTPVSYGVVSNCSSDADCTKPLSHCDTTNNKCTYDMWRFAWVESIPREIWSGEPIERTRAIYANEVVEAKWPSPPFTSKLLVDWQSCSQGDIITNQCPSGGMNHPHTAGATRLDRGPAFNSGNLIVYVHEDDNVMGSEIKASFHWTYPNKPIVIGHGTADGVTSWPGSRPRVAYDPNKDRFLAVWANGTAGVTGAWIERIATAPYIVARPANLFTNGFEADVAYDESMQEMVVVWTAPGGSMLALRTNGGQFTTPNPTILVGINNASHPRIVFDNKARQTFVAYNQPSGNQWNILYTCFSEETIYTPAQVFPQPVSTPNKVAPYFSLTDVADPYQPSLDAHVAIAYETPDSTSGQPERDIEVMSIIGCIGDPSKVRLSSDPTDERMPAVAASDKGRAWVAWHDGEQCSADGVTVSSTRQSAKAGPPLPYQLPISNP